MRGHRDGSSHSLPACRVSFHVQKNGAQDLGQQGTDIHPIRWRIAARGKMHLTNLQILAESRRRNGGERMHRIPSDPGTALRSEHLLEQSSRKPQVRPHRIVDSFSVQTAHQRRDDAAV